MQKRVYVNRTLNLRKIRYLGFDMDHTLVRYDSRAFEATTHDEVLKKLVDRKGYPRQILELPFDYDLAIRGLVIDKRRGNVLKVSRHGAIRGAMHGLRMLDFTEQKRLYRSTYIDLRDSGYSSVDTAFSISTANLFVQLVDFKDSHPQLPLPDYETIGNDLMNTVDEAHRDGTLKSIVRANLAKYILREPDVVASLERFKQHDKRLFVVTNSDIAYTKLLLDFAIQPFLRRHKHWSELFDFVVAGAQKPRFFFEQNPFLRVNLHDNTLTPLEGKLVPGIYTGGSAVKFTDDLDLEGDDILYIGDHIYGDVVRLKKDCNWRTALVLEDLEHEIPKYEVVRPIQAEIDRLMKKKEPLEDLHVDLHSRKIEHGAEPPAEEIQRLIQEMGDIDRQVAEKIRHYQAAFNSRWGEVMRSGNEESHFAHQVDRFACIYMAKLGDLLERSPRTYFRAARRPLAHEMAIRMTAEVSPFE